MKMHIPLRRVVRLRTTLRRLAWGIVLAPFFWYLIILLTAKVFVVNLDKNAFLIWAITSLGLMLSTFIVLWGESNKFSNTIDMVEERYKNAIMSIEKDVRRYVETSILFKDSPDEMRKLLLDDLQRFFSSSESDIVILGADGLRPSSEAFGRLQERLGKGELSAQDQLLYEYGLIFNTILAASSPKALRRFIYLFSPGELEGRTPDFQDSYVKWLVNQASWLRINPKYTITSTPRATVWGAPKSIIFVGNTLAEVFFKGGGVVITSRSGRSDSVVATTRKSLVDGYVDVTEDKGGPPRRVYTQERALEFEQYIAELQKRLREPKAPI